MRSKYIERSKVRQLSGSPIFSCQSGMQLDCSPFLIGAVKDDESKPTVINQVKFEV